MSPYKGGCRAVLKSLDITWAWKAIIYAAYGSTAVHVTSSFGTVQWNDCIGTRHDCVRFDAKASFRGEGLALLDPWMAKLLHSDFKGLEPRIFEIHPVLQPIGYLRLS